MWVFRSCLLLLCLNTPLSLAFQARPTRSTFRRLAELATEDNGSSHDDPALSVVGDLDCVTTPHSSEMYDALRARLVSMERGIGKRYVCRTQKGFLNIHQEPGDPYAAYNVVGQLREGDIVTSTGPNRGAWIRHDRGGWSISIFGGFTWLEELKE